MTKKEAIKAAQADVRAGKDRKGVFEAYKQYFSRPLQLASVISSIAREDVIKQNKGLNMILVVLLILTGLVKALGVFVTLIGTNFLLAIFLTLLSLAVPFLFAFEVNRFNGQIYGILTFLAGISILNVLLSIQEGPVAALIAACLLGGILALTLVLRKKLFPGMKLLGVKTDGSGNYLLG